MDTLKFLDAVKNQDMKELSGSERKLADDLLVALSQTSTDFHANVFHLLDGITEENDLAELVGTINSLPRQERTQLIAMITTGEATEEFMRSLDTNPQLQRAVDIAFSGHIDQLHDLGEALDNARAFIDEKKKDKDKNS